MISDYLSFDHYAQVNQLLFIVREQKKARRFREQNFQYNVPDGFEMEINQSQQQHQDIYILRLLLIQTVTSSVSCGTFTF